MVAKKTYRLSTNVYIDAYTSSKGQGKPSFSPKLVHFWWQLVYDIGSQRG